MRTSGEQFSFLLDNFVAQTGGVEDALVVSADGIKIATSEGLSETIADQFGAIASGLASLTLGAARCFDQQNVHRIIIEMDDSYLLVVNITNGAVLAVVAAKSADVGIVAYDMTLFSERAGEILDPGTIAELKNSLIL